MTLSLVAFSISSFGLVGLIAMKRLQMKKRGGKILALLSRKFDRKLWRYSRVVVFMSLGLAHKVHIRVRFWVRVVLKRAIRNAYISLIRKISMHGRKIIDIERRERKLFRKHGAVSFFLKDIVSHKQTLHK